MTRLAPGGDPPGADPNPWQARLEAVWDGPVLVSHRVPDLNEDGEPCFWAVDDTVGIHRGRRMLVIHPDSAERLHRTFSWTPG